MNEIITKNFQDNNFRIFIIKNKEFFFAKDTSSLLGYTNPQKAIRDHCKKVISFKDVFNMNESFTLDLSRELGNNWKQTKLIPESDVWRLIIKSRLPEAEKIEEWIMEEVLPQIRKTGSYSLSSDTSQEISLKEKLELEFVGVKNTIEILRVNQASKIGMIEVVHKKYDLETSYLPKYSDEEHTYSAKALLEKFGVKISVQQFNKKMISAGFLETKTRKSSKYKTEKDENGKEVKIPILKEFKSLTEKGLEFGKNLISPKNQLETQPHYFESKFSELLEILKIG
ncbi:prophage antirepressor [Thiovulum sp. ES]|nr:prophage antirepressor [Thiovulum sp. ES]